MTATATNFTPLEIRQELRHLARVWDGAGCRDHAGCRLVTRAIREGLLDCYTDPGLPAHTEGDRRCGCLDCLWDEFRGALAMLEGVYERTVHWQDVAPEYGVTDDPEGQFLIDLEMEINGLLDDLMGARR
jgi:hypothetical protein